MEKNTQRLIALAARLNGTIMDNSSQFMMRFLSYRNDNPIFVWICKLLHKLAPEFKYGIDGDTFLLGTDPSKYNIIIKEIITFNQELRDLGLKYENVNEQQGKDLILVGFKDLCVKPRRVFRPIATGYLVRLYQDLIQEEKAWKYNLEEKERNNEIFLEEQIRSDRLLMLLKSKGVHRLLPKYGRMHRVYIYHDRLPTINETVDSMINNNADDANISIVKDWFINLVENLTIVEYSFSGAWVYFYSPQSDIITEHILNLNERLLQSDYVCVDDIFYNVESAANLILCFGFTNLLHKPKCPKNKFIITESIRQIYARIHNKL